MIITESEIRVRYGETDMMGFAYHANYFAWFEVARIDFLDKIGIPYQTIEEKGYRLPVLEANARFIKPVLFDYQLTIKTIIREKPRVKIKIDYEVYNHDKLHCSGYTRHGFINFDGTPLRPPSEFIDRVDTCWKEV